jgi:hypothetical protein
MGSIDAWWNRNFPPYSGRRLLFFLVVAPLMAAAIGLLHGELSGSRSLFVGIAMDVMICLTWFVAREKADEITPAPWTPPVPGIPPATPPPSPPGPKTPSFDHEAMSQLMEPRRRRLSRSADFLLTFAISSAGMLLVLVIMNDPVLVHLPMAIGAGLLLTTAIVFRYSVWPLVLFSLVIGYGGAVVLRLFLSWVSGDDGILEYWLISSLLAFVFLAPMWWSIRQARPSLERIAIPSWVIAAGTVILLALGLAFAFFDTDESYGGSARDVSTAQPAAGSLGASTREEASTRLLDAWRANSREAAAQVARDAAVDALFVRSADPTAVFKGCGTVGAGWPRCAIATATELMLLAPEPTGGGQIYISFIERRPLDYPIEYSAGSP